MGTLVFQATLGGAVNIIGPNIANTINFTLPSADGTSGQTWTTNGSGVLAFGTLGIAGGGTGQITATAAFNALAPSQSGQSGKYLTTDGTNTSWGTNPLGTVTSVAVSGGTTGLTTSGGPITTSGTITFAGTLATSNGGTGLSGATPFTSGGVVYASSSSALATGSALTFDGTSILSNLSTSSAPRYRIGYNSSTYADWYRDASTGNYTFESQEQGSAFIWSLRPSGGSATEGMRLTSSSLYTASGISVGIGLSSPNGLFNVKGTNGQVLLANGNTSGGMKITATNSTFTADGYLAFEGYTKEYGRFDSSGNLGLGVTPSAWATFKAIQIAGAGSIHSTGNGNMRMGSNFYFNGTNYIRTGADYANMYSQNDSSGYHAWFNAASSTAGSTISWTQAMTLDASGYLLVGATSSAGVGSNRLQVGSSGSAAQILAKSATNHIGLYASSGADSYMSYATGAALLIGNGPADGSTFAERARIDSSGNLLVGKDSTNLTIQGVRIDTNGIVSSATGSGSDFWNTYNTTASAYRFYVSNAGTVFATSTTISAISDIRFKENVRDLNVGLAEVLALKPRLYDWKEGKGTNIKNARGFIAQEFEEIFPDLIDEWKDEAPEGEAPYKSVRQDLIPVLVKAMQEQQAMIESLKARLDAANL
jgi:hypothetical protein